MFDSIFLAIETWMRGMLTSMVDEQFGGHADRRSDHHLRALLRADLDAYRAQQHA